MRSLIHTLNSHPEVHFPSQYSEDNADLTTTDGSRGRALVSLILITSAQLMLVKPVEETKVYAISSKPPVTGNRALLTSLTMQLHQLRFGRSHTSKIHI